MNRRIKRPTADPIAQVQLRIQSTMPKMQGPVEDREPWKRRLSMKVAAELRRQGLLLPENEGAAPGSWWTPGVR